MACCPKSPLHHNVPLSHPPCPKYLYCLQLHVVFHCRTSRCNVYRIPSLSSFFYKLFTSSSINLSLPIVNQVYGQHYSLALCCALSSLYSCGRRFDLTSVFYIINPFTLFSWSFSPTRHLLATLATTIRHSTRIYTNVHIWTLLNVSKRIWTRSRAPIDQHPHRKYRAMCKNATLRSWYSSRSPNAMLCRKASQ